MQTHTRCFSFFVASLHFSESRASSMIILACCLLKYIYIFSFISFVYRLYFFSRPFARKEFMCCCCCCCRSSFSSRVRLCALMENWFVCVSPVSVCVCYACPVADDERILCRSFFHFGFWIFWFILDQRSGGLDMCCSGIHAHHVARFRD